MTCFCFLFNRTVILGNMTAIQLYMLHMQELSGFTAPVVDAVLDGILHSTVTSAEDLWLLRELCMVIQLMIILIVTDILRDTVKTFQQVKSQLDSTLEGVSNTRRLMMAIQEVLRHLAL